MRTIDDLSGSGTVASMFEPSGAPAASVVACHGGLDGLDEPFSDRCQDLANRGLLVLAPHYRGEDGRSDPSERRVGESDVADALRCFQWLLAKTAAPAFFWGNSRGGLVALLAASAVDSFGCVVTAPIDSVATFYEIMSRRDHPSATEITERLGGTPDEVAERYGALDGATLGRRGTPVFLAHAADDPVVPIEHSIGLSHRLVVAGSPVTALFVPSGGHRLIETSPALWDEAAEFMRGAQGVGAVAMSGAQR